MSYEEKGVNTRSQGVMETTASHSGDEDADNSLMARRRRRRERAQTAYIMNVSSIDGLVQPQTTDIINTNMPPPPPPQQQQQPAVAPVEGHQMTLADQRRLLRAAYSLNSVDADDVFYDAVPASHNPAAYKQL